MHKIYYSIGEVAEILGENTSLVRFWSDTFPRFIHPSRNAKGNRMFTGEDVETFRQIHHLVSTGLTLEGVARKLEQDRASVAAEVRVLESLKKIRQQLQEVRMTFLRNKK